MGQSKERSSQIHFYMSLYSSFTYPLYYMSPSTCPLMDLIQQGASGASCGSCCCCCHRIDSSECTSHEMNTTAKYADLLNCRRFGELCVADTPGDLEELALLLQEVSGSNAWEDVNCQVYFLHVLCASDTRIHLLRKYFPLPSSIELYETPYKGPNVVGECTDQCETAFCFSYLQDQGTLAIHTTCMSGSSATLEYIIHNTPESSDLLVGVDERNCTPLFYCAYNSTKTCSTTAPLLVDEMARRGLSFSDVTSYDEYRTPWKSPQVTAIHWFIRRARCYGDGTVEAQHMISLVRHMLAVLTREQWIELEDVAKKPFIFDIVLVEGLQLFDFVVDKMKAIDYRVNVIEEIESFSSFCMRMWYTSWFDNIIDYFGDIALTFNSSFQGTIVDIILRSHESQTTLEQWDAAEKILDRVPDEVFFRRCLFTQISFLHTWASNAHEKTCGTILSYIRGRVSDDKFFETDRIGRTPIHAAYKYHKYGLIEAFHSMFDECQLRAMDNYGSTPFHLFCFETSLKFHPELLARLSFVASLTPKAVFTQPDRCGLTPRDILMARLDFSESDVDSILGVRAKGAML